MKKLTILVGLLLVSLTSSAQHLGRPINAEPVKEEQATEQEKKDMQTMFESIIKDFDYSEFRKITFNDKNKYVGLAEYFTERGVFLLEANKQIKISNWELFNLIQNYDNVLNNQLTQLQAENESLKTQLGISQDFHKSSRDDANEYQRKLREKNAIEKPVIIERNFYFGR